ncbi:MAG: response regulator [Candidatus Riflebacteria bacterium]|nr:response regulator [Candidatus Riflebacteria bacterium]
MTTQKPKQTVLIVDDTPVNAELLRAILAKEHGVALASCGQEALDICAHELPDLILLDVMMPGMDGYEVCTRLKADESSRSVPIIFVTAKDQTGDETRGLDLGAIDYIIKPVRPAIVRARVRNHLELRRIEKEREELIRKLQEALANVQMLQGLLPICAWCKRIRDDKGYWSQVETYISERSRVQFSHGMCPQCFQKNVDEEGL